MYKIYNTQSEISTNISNFLLKSFPNIRKTQLNIIPYIIFGMIISNSCSASSIAVSNYFKDTNFKIVFLADRWFNSQEILKHIDDSGHSFCIRLKGNLKINTFDKNEKNFIHKYTLNLKGRKYKGTYYTDVYLYEDYSFKTNITISKSDAIDEPWIVATNDDPKNAIRHYSHRFGGIESIFKNQKSNGFNLEKINNSSLKSFTSMYSLLCFCITWLIMIGADYTKNSKCYKNVKIETIKKYSDGTSVRTVSLFKLGLILFKRAFNSSVYIRIPYKFILYDV